MTQILMQNMTVRSWLVMTNNFEHKGKNNFQIKKTNRWMGKNSKTLFCKFIARGWKWNVHESVSNDIQINFFNNHHYWNYLYLWEILPWQMYDNMQTNENTLQYEWDFEINTSNLQFPKLCIILWPLSVFKDQSLFFGIMTKVLLSSTWLSSFTIIGMTGWTSQFIVGQWTLRSFSLNIQTHSPSWTLFLWLRGNLRLTTTKQEAAD